MGNIKVRVPYFDVKTGKTEMRDGVDIDFSPLKPETFAEYELEDGSILKMRQTLTRVTRIEGIFNDDGTPVYNLEAQGQIIVGSKKDET